MKLGNVSKHIGWAMANGSTEDIDGVYTMTGAVSCCTPLCRAVRNVPRDEPLGRAKGRAARRAPEYIRQTFSIGYETCARLSKPLFSGAKNGFAHSWTNPCTTTRRGRGRAMISAPGRSHVNFATQGRSATETTQKHQRKVKRSRQSHRDQRSCRRGSMADGMA